MKDSTDEESDRFLAMVTAKAEVDLRLSDFAPRTMLVTPEHEIARPRFPAIDYHNHLDAQEPRGHFEVIGGLIEAELVDHGEELVGDLRDRQVGDVDFVFADQMQQQVERAGEFLQLDDEASTRAGHDGTPFGRRVPATRCNATPRRCTAGQRKKSITPGSRKLTAKIGKNPKRWSCRYCIPRPGGRI